ncbi:hypothetical protein, partial [Caproiciproducens galactitolivorans]
VNRRVVGSSPTWGAKRTPIHWNRCFLLIWKNVSTAGPEEILLQALFLPTGREGVEDEYILQMEEENYLLKGTEQIAPLAKCPRFAGGHIYRIRSTLDRKRRNPYNNIIRRHKSFDGLLFFKR